MAWCVRVRDIKGKMYTLDLPDAQDTTLHSLRDLIASLTRTAKKRVIITTGRPSSPVITPSTDLSQPIGTLLQNRDLLVIVKDSPSFPSPSTPAPTQPKAPSPSPIPPPAHSSPTAVRVTGRGDVVPRPPKRRRVRMAGVGVALGTAEGGEGDGGGGGGEGGEEGSAQQPRGFYEDGLAQISSTLAAAASHSSASPADPTVAGVMRSLRATFRAERQKAGAEMDAVDKIRAAIGGDVEFLDISDGTFRMKVTFRKSARKQVSECVQNIPPFLIRAILTHVANDPDPTTRANLEPRNMAALTPRMFWSIVRHGRVGPDRSIEEALMALAPDLDWAPMFKRESRRPERYADFESH